MNATTAIVLLLAAATSVLAITGCRPSEVSEVDYLQESKEDFDARMRWWRDARFGLFIHWGPYAVPAGIHRGDSIGGIGEWIMNTAQIPVEEYETYARQFNPVQFDPDEWVRMARDAGMKYIIITSKHHDGFCLWDSDVTDYDVNGISPFGRDILGELKEASDRYDIRLGFYHSIMDWHHPDAQAPHWPTYNTQDKLNPNFSAFVRDYLTPQITELIERYDPAVMWFDGEWIPEWTAEQGRDMYRLVRRLKPDILINNRVGKGRQGMQGMDKTDQDYAGDFGTPEQEILEGTSTLDWESCMTMNDTWGFKSTDHNWKSSEMLIHNLVDIVSKGGNYLLNVGPTAEGLIPQESVDRLADMGEWMRVNGEAVYGSRLWDHYKDGERVRYTHPEGPYVYAISLGWPGEELVLTRVQPAEGSEVVLLGSSAEIPWSTANDSTTLHVPASLQPERSRPGKYAYAFRIEPR